MDIWKDYNSLYWERDLELLASYGFDHRTIQLLWMYWDHLTMVAKAGLMATKAGRYFGHPFKGYRGITQGDPLYPTIFNVVADTVIRHLVMVVTPT